MTAVRPRARSHTDRAGDPLDGLVNLFDVAIVLAVAFLLVALTALRQGSVTAKPGQVVIPTNAPVISPGPQPASGRGSKVGSVYRTTDGRLIYVPGG